jgi:hypothetical protein
MFTYHRHYDYDYDRAEEAVLPVPHCRPQWQ